ncbi:protein FAM204A [Ixodes scapularis]
MNAAVHPALSDDDEELDLSEIDIFVRRPIEPKGSPTRTSSGSSKFLSQTSSAPLYVRPDLRMRFQEASGEASQLRERTAALSRRTEQRRRSRLRKRLAREANAAPEGTTQTESSDWSGVREFLTVNDHLAGPVSHGDCGPKDDEIAVTAEKISTILKAAGVEVEPYWPGLFAKALEGLDLKALISNVGSGVGSGPAAAAAPAAGAAAAAPTGGKDAPKKEEKKEESEEEDDDMGFGLFD